MVGSGDVAQLVVAALGWLGTMIALAFFGGKLVQKVNEIERRIGAMEANLETLERQSRRQGGNGWNYRA